MSKTKKLLFFLLLILFGASFFLGGSESEKSWNEIQSLKDGDKKLKAYEDFITKKGLFPGALANYRILLNNNDVDNNDELIEKKYHDRLKTEVAWISFAYILFIFFAFKYYRSKDHKKEILMACAMFICLGITKLSPELLKENMVLTKEKTYKYSAPFEKKKSEAKTKAFESFDHVGEAGSFIQASDLSGKRFWLKKKDVLIIE